MQIDWWTLALQGVNFLLLVWLLWRFLYRPVKQVIEKRKELAEQAFAEADRQKKEADEARQRFETDRAALGQERQDLLKKAHDDLDAERRKVLDEAEKQADRLLVEARESIARERDAALKDIREQVAALAHDMAAGLLGKLGSANVSAPFLEEIAGHLEALPAEERARLRKDLAAQNPVAKIVTAAALSKDEQGRWIERISAAIGQDVRADFATDPAILGGAELHFAHAVLRFTWADQLRKAGELLGKDDAAS